MELDFKLIKELFSSEDYDNVALGINVLSNINPFDLNLEEIEILIDIINNYIRKHSNSLPSNLRSDIESKQNLIIFYVELLNLKDIKCQN